MPVETVWKPSPQQQALIGILNKYQDDNDLRPSDMVSLLLGLAEYFAPTSGAEITTRIVDDWRKHMGSIPPRT